MRHSSEFYKVVNAVINTLNHGEAVVYVSGGQGGSGEGIFDCDEDNDKVRNSLLQFAKCEELDEDELLNDWSEEVLTGASKSGFDFWELSGYGDNAPCLQVMINPDYYVTSSYELRDMICDDTDLKAAEITTGMNGYPRGLRGAVLLGGSGKTIEQMQELADMYGVELVSLHRRDGWQLWECEGWTSGLYDYVGFVEGRNDNLHYWESYKAYAEELREYANGGDMDEDMKQEFLDAAEKAEGMELGENEFLYCENGFPYLTDPTKADRMVDHFSYDTHNYTLALDCIVTG